MLQIEQLLTEYVTKSSPTVRKEALEIIPKLMLSLKTSSAEDIKQVYKTLHQKVEQTQGRVRRLRNRRNCKYIHHDIIRVDQQWTEWVQEHSVVRRNYQNTVHMYMCKTWLANSRAASHHAVGRYFYPTASCLILHIRILGFDFCLEHFPCNIIVTSLSV